MPAQIECMPILSIIIPVYNVEKYFNRCIDSILNQTFVDFECILVDDGSTDICPEICDYYAKQDNRIKVIHKNNGGVSSARNAGLDVAAGDYISFVDSDDVIHLQMYELLFKALSKYNTSAATAQMSVSDKILYEKYDPESVVGNVYTKDEIYDSIFHFIYSPYYREVISCGIYAIYPKYAFENIRFDENLCMGEDIDVIIRMNMNIDSVVNLKVPLYFYETENESATRSVLNKKSLTVLSFYGKIINYLYENRIRDKDKFQYLYFYAFFDTYIKAKQLKIEKEFEKYKSCFKKDISSICNSRYIGVKEKVVLYSFLCKEDWGMRFFGHYEQKIVDKKNILLGWRR